MARGLAPSGPTSNRHRRRLTATAAHAKLRKTGAAMPSRRTLLAQAAGLAGAALTPAAWTSAVAKTRMADDPFGLGVASGEPLPDGMVLWTRLAPRPQEVGAGMGTAPVEVRWEIAE